MRKCRLRFAGTVCLLGAAASLAAAQTKLGYVDAQRILEKSSEGRKIVARLNEADQKNQAIITRLDDDIRQLQAKLSTQRLTLSEEAAARYSADLEKKNTDRKRQAEDAYAYWTQLRDRLFGGLQTELVAVITQVGKEKGYDLVIDLGKSGAVYWNPALDLSEEVIRRYDASKTPTK
ncbi:MAG: OmpH family outer membrane protein [Acidobacteriota bacterium]|nr:OmpH family outer membrane protein [Acidobacteriota bacterium]